MRIKVPANSAASSPTSVRGLGVSTTTMSSREGPDGARDAPGGVNRRSDLGLTAMESVPLGRTAAKWFRDARPQGQTPWSHARRAVERRGSRGRHDPDAVHLAQRSAQMAGNRGVAYIEPGKVEVHQTDYPKLELQDGPGVNPANVGRKLNHGAILKVVTTNICGSDQHMVRGRTTAPPNLVLGHEITGEVVEKGRDVEFIDVGDVCSVPFNIACGRCRNCKEGKTGICLNVNPARPGAAYGYVDMGGWVGGQAEYAMVPYADWNLLRFPDKDQAMEKITDLTMLSDIFPTGFHGAVTAGVKPG